MVKGHWKINNTRQNLYCIFGSKNFLTFVTFLLYKQYSIFERLKSEPWSIVSEEERRKGVCQRAKVMSVVIEKCHNNFTSIISRWLKPELCDGCYVIIIWTQHCYSLVFANQFKSADKFEKFLENVIISPDLSIDVNHYYIILFFLFLSLLIFQYIR